MRWTQPGETYESNLAQPLIDDELWAPLLRAIRDARRSVDLVQLLFETDFAPAGPRLVDALEGAARRGTRVRVLVNENAAVPDSYDELAEHFETTPVEVRRLTMSPNVLHSKLLIADDEEAFLLDAPFEAKYDDTRGHIFDSSRRRGNQPLHSVSLRLRGAAVARVADVYERLWEAAAGVPFAPLPDRPPRAAAEGPQTLKLCWTTPAGILAPEEETCILDAYAQALARARHFVYIETQYFTSPRMTRLIADALEREPELQVILALNEHMDVPSYDTWQAKRLQELRYEEHPRLGVFGLWSPRRAPAARAIRRVYLHSKVAIVDDAWATIGSANLDSISLHEAQEFLMTTEPNVELNAILLDGIDDAPATGAVPALRRRLWGEHLGDERVWSGSAPPGGWLALWREAAAENLAAFERDEDPPRGRVFPYGPLSKVRREALSPRGGSNQ